MNNIYLFTTHERFDIPRITETSRPNAIKAITKTKVFLKSEFEKHGKKSIPLSEGIAECAIGDQFSRKLGRRISAGRALKKLGLRMHENKIEQLPGTAYRIYDLENTKTDLDKQDNLYLEIIRLHKSGTRIKNFEEVVKLLENLSVKQIAAKLRLDVWIGTKVAQSIKLAIQPNNPEPKG